MIYKKDIVISRVGSMKYLESELVDGGSPVKIVSLFRGEKVLEDKASSVTGLPLTIEHDPESPVIGSVAVAWYSSKEKAIVGDIILSDSKYAGSEISLGYEAFINRVDKDKYELVDFVPNHVSVTKSGRCGTICKI